MKKIILGMFVFALFVSTSVYAQNTMKKNVDTTCVAEAVVKREDTVQTAWKTFNDKISASLVARKDALEDAWALSEKAERKTAVKKAWADAKASKKSAMKEYKTSQKNAWALFKKSAKACGGDVSSEASSDKEPVEKLEI